MAKGLNKAQVIGNMVADPELRTGQKSNMMTGRIATSESWRDRETGEQRENTEYISLVCYGKLADVFHQYVHKGDKVYVEGKIQTRDYEKDGVKHYMTQIVVTDLLMLGSPSGNTSNRDSRPPASNPKPQEDFDDDIPF